VVSVILRGIRGAEEDDTGEDGQFGSSMTIDSITLSQSASAIVAVGGVDVAVAPVPTCFSIPPTTTTPAPLLQSVLEPEPPPDSMIGVGCSVSLLHMIGDVVSR